MDFKYLVCMLVVCLSSAAGGYKLCEFRFQQNAEDVSFACAVVGQAARDKGDTIEAMIWFSRASGLASKSHAPALALAEILQMQGLYSVALLEARDSHNILQLHGSEYGYDEEHRELQRLETLIQELELQAISVKN